MPELKTRRPFEQRFLNGYDRSQLRQDVQKVRPMRGMKKRATSIALGASLAIGAVGAPVVIQQTTESPATTRTLDDTGDAPEKATTISVDKEIANDLKAARSIAQQVAGGVQAAAKGVERATASPLDTVSEAPRQLAVVTESTREQFFKTEVPFGSIIYREAKKHNVRPELVAAVVQAESRFKPNARSGAGAVGLMQLVPRTGRWMGARDLTNPVQNIAAGTKYLKYLSERFDGNETKIIAAYNAGEGNVKRFGGVPPFKETRNYVKKVRNNEREFKEQIQSRIADAGLAAAAVAN